VLFSQRFRLLAQARRTADFPKDEGVPEVAFAGRSNVGKSSLLKALSVRGAKVLVKVRGLSVMDFITCLADWTVSWVVWLFFVFG